ncbi:MAG: sigma-54 dependent transcriptional regulator [Planctomycetota bacterium]|nr:sigma-54 dependent transcriptional regulator [Planctomycetota bacterium]
MKLRVMVVDDERLSRETTTFQLQEAGYGAEAFETAEEALRAFENQTWDLVLTDLRMPGMDGLKFLKELKSRRSDLAVILMTAHGGVRTAIEAIREGAYDYLTKPFDFDELKVRLERLHEYRRIRDENRELRRTLSEATARHGLVGHSAEMRRVCGLIDQFAGLPSHVLILGETGTGKELVARALHARSANAQGPFVAVGCAAIPEDLAESELFGHESGAFTGATRRRKGRVELAEGGTLFLDDVDDMPLDLQAKLLRVIQEKQFERVGGEKSIQANLRVVAATKVDLEEHAKAGKFREDLMYRLSVLVISLAPLRERKEDIPHLAGHFLGLIGLEHGKEPKTLSPAALERLMAHAWPGNVRELRHAMEYAMAVTKGPVIEPEDLPVKVKPGASGSRPYALKLADRETLDLRAAQQDFEQDLIQWALDKAGGNQVKAAQILGVPRSTLQSKLNEK